MATSTFDRPLVLEKEEDIERFWDFMNNAKPQPIYLDKDFWRRMEECTEALIQKARAERSQQSH